MSEARADIISWTCTSPVGLNTHQLRTGQLNEESLQKSIIALYLLR